MWQQREVDLAHDRSGGLGAVLNQVRRLHQNGRPAEAQRVARMFLWNHGDRSTEAEAMLVRLATDAQQHQHFLPGESIHAAGTPMRSVRVVTDGRVDLVHPGGRIKTEVGVDEVIALAGALGGPATRLGLSTRAGAGVLSLRGPLLARLLRHAAGYRKVVDQAVRTAHVRALLPFDGGFVRLNPELRRLVHLHFNWVSLPAGAPLAVAGEVPTRLVLVLQGEVRFGDGRTAGAGTAVGWVDDPRPARIGAQAGTPIVGLLLTRAAYDGARAATQWAAAGAA